MRFGVESKIELYKLYGWGIEFPTNHDEYN